MNILKIDGGTLQLVLLRRSFKVVLSHLGDVPDGHNEFNWFMMVAVATHPKDPVPPLTQSALGAGWGDGGACRDWPGGMEHAAE
jgi:hypothetical protein